MKSSHALCAAWLLLLLVLVPVTLQAGEPSPVPKAPDYQLLVNPSMEVFDEPYGSFDGVDCQVATGWESFWYDSPEPYWMDVYVFAHSHLGSGHVEVIDGDTCQLLLSTQPYTAGIQQQVGGLTPGLGYGFHAAMLTIYQTSAQPPVDGKMIKQVGIDPTGGTDPAAPTVVWSTPDDHDQGPWDITRHTAAYAQSSTVTVFIRVISPDGAGEWPYLNLSFLDSAILAQTGTVSASSPALSNETSFAVRWDNAQSLGGGTIVRYDVEWLDEAEGVWNEWYTWTKERQAIFTGQRGHAYRFRARVWQRYPNGAHLFSPYSQDGDTRTLVTGSRLAGRVLTNEGRPLIGATVAISGTAYAVTSAADGLYSADIQAFADPQIVTVSHPLWLAPAAVYSLTVAPTETVSLTWTMRPVDDVVVNGEFEAGLEGWSATSGQLPVPAVVTEPVHTGLGAAVLGGAPLPRDPLSPTVALSQTVAVTGAWEPVLSFWYRPVSTDTGDLFNVLMTVVTQTISATQSADGRLPVTVTVPVTTTRIYTPTLALGDWQHLWYHAGLPDAALTGTVTVRFQMRQDGDGEATTVYLDEVSLGSTPGGPQRVYLPLLLRGF
jgi:hypothetical protein